MKKVYSYSREIGDELKAKPSVENRPEQRVISFEPKQRMAPVQKSNVYGGTLQESKRIATDRRNAPSPVRSGKKTKFKFSMFNAVMLMFGVATIFLLYVYNVISIRGLMVDINRLEVRRQQLLTEQELLKAQYDRLSSLERVRTIAINELGMRDATEPPTPIPIDPERVARATEEVSKSLNKD
jgi:cell division protein FtsL